MNTNKWRIFIASTDRDLKYARNAVSSAIRNWGFETVLFEEDNFLIDSELHSHDTCIASVKTCDLFILILDRRSGGSYLGIKDAPSITQKEYEAALENDIPVIPFVNKNLEQERFDLVQNIKDNNKSISEVDLLQHILSSHTHYADSPKLIHFLQNIQKRHTGNFITFFDDLHNLIHGVENRLKAITPTILRRLSYFQLDYVNTRATTLGKEFNLNSLLHSSYFIKPHFHKIGNANNLTETDILNDIGRTNNSFSIILGKPGSGKSVSVNKLFISLAIESLNSKSNIIPIYFDLKYLKDKNNFSLKGIINQAFTIYTKKEPYPLIDYKIIEIIFFLDGLDEIPSSIINEVINHPDINTFKLTRGIVSSRDSFFDIHVRGSSFETSLKDIFFINNWSKEQGVNYIHSWLLELNNDELASRFIESSNDAKYSEILSSPILSSMFAFIIKSLDTIPVELNDKVTLYKFFIRQLAIREVNKITSLNTHETDIENIINIWQITSWVLYNYKSELHSLYIDVLKNLLLKYGYEDFIINQALSGLIVINPVNGEVKSLLHETLLEYLLASYGILTMLDGGDWLVNYMNCNLASEVSAFVKEIWNRMNSDKLALILKNLSKCIQSSILLEDEKSQRRMANLIYYLSRLPLLNEVIKELRCLINCNLSIFTKNGVLFALTKLGDVDSEEQLANDLINNIEANNLNRGLHLVYFGDISPLSHFPPFDPGSSSVDKSLFFLFEHLNNPTERNLSTLRIDIITILSLAYTRKVLNILLIEKIEMILSKISIKGYRNILIIEKSKELLNIEYVKNWKSLNQS